MYRIIALAAVTLLTLTACGSNDSQAPEHAASLSKALSEQPVVQHQELAPIETQTAAPAAEVATPEVEGCEELQDKIIEETDPAVVVSEPAMEQPTTSILTLRMVNDFGPVFLTHSDHVDMMTCDSCHTSNPPSKINKTKKEFHALCRKCHVDNGAGPTKCRDCHERP